MATTSSPTFFSSGLLAATLVAGCSLIIDTDTKKLGPVQGGTGDAGAGGADCKACDDHIDCTQDICDPKLGCVHQPQVSRCGDNVNCTIDTCDVRLGCQHEASDAHCDFCAPGSMCDPKVGGCVHATSLRDCSDNDPCTADACKVALMMCVSNPIDADSDTYAAAEVQGRACQGSDCDDTNPQVHPGAPELCDGLDNDCNGHIDDNCMGSKPDTCSSAGAVQLSAQGVAVLGGAFDGLTSDFDVSCGAMGAPDAIYKLAIAQISDIVIETQDGDSDVVLAAGTSCDAGGFGFACAAPMNNHRTRLVFHHYDPSVQGGQLFVLVEPRQPNKSGAYHLRVSVSPAQPDDCDTGVFDFTGCGTLVGFIPDLQPENDWGTLAGSCSPSVPFIGRTQPPEAVVKVSSPGTGTLNLTASSDEFTPTLFARSSCKGDLSPEYGCSRALLGPATVQVTPQSAGEIYVVVDTGTNKARYTLQCE